MHKMQIDELIISLQKEYLFIHNEKTKIHKLFNKIQSIYDELYRHQYVLLSQQLISIEHRSQSSSIDSSLFHLDHINSFFWLESRANFLKLSSVYAPFEPAIVDVFRVLSSDTNLLTALLLFCDERGLNGLRLASVVYKSVLGSAISVSDSDRVVSVLLALIERQFSACTEPQKMIIGDKCVFIRFFKFYIDNCASAKTFLIATLQQPIEFVLVNDDSFVDINWKLSLERMSHQEKLRLFGDPRHTDSYQHNIDTFRNTVLNRITEAVTMFVKKLTESFILLPNNYVMIVNHLYKTLSSNVNVKKIDVLRTCVDFIFDCFIYPAMLNPESYGIIGDFPLSSVSKHNLMEIGKVIKSLIYLEITKVHDPSSVDSSSRLSLPVDLLDKFENYSLSSFLRELSIWSESTISNMDFDNDQPPEPQMDITRSVALICEGDLHFLLKILKCYTLDSSVECNQLVEILDRIRQIEGDSPLKNCVRNRDITSLSSSLKEGVTNTKFYYKPEEIESLDQTTVNNNDLNVFILIIKQYIECPGMKSEDKVLKEYKCHCENSNDARKTHNCIFHGERNLRKQNTDNSFSSFGHRNSRRDSSSSRSCVSSGETSSSCRKVKDSTVDKVMKSLIKTEDSTKISFATSEIGKRKTHFNESNDQESTGATSDIVEGISEVASTHSAQSEDVDSRLDMDDNNDQSRIVFNEHIPDVTDNMTNQINDIAAPGSIENVNNNQSLVSGEREPALTNEIAQSTAGSNIDLEELRTSGAGLDDASSNLDYWPNMSGRDTPSMSGGRESPSSSVGGSDLPNNINKPDVTDKFWKFDIPKTVEARSTVSDTWSTDVLASDSEPTEQADNMRRLVEIQEENHPANQSQIASGSEDNTDMLDWSLKVANSSLTDKHDQVANKVITPVVKVPISHNSQSTDQQSTVTKETNNLPSIQLETTLIHSSNQKSKSISISRSNMVSGRSGRNNTLFHTTCKEEEKARAYSHTFPENPASGSPSSIQRGLVHKIRDKFSGGRAKKETKVAKLEIYDTKITTDEIDKNVEKTEKVENTDFSESIEQMLLRYDTKSSPRTPEYVSILNKDTEDSSPAPVFFDHKIPPEEWPAWKVAKKNLRLILEKNYLKHSHEKLLFLIRSSNDIHPLIRLLRLYLAEAHLLQNDVMITQLEEAIRVVQLFDNESLNRMISSMLKDWKQRKTYISYLVNTHLELRLIKKRAEELLARCNRSCQVTSRSMISSCVHQILRQQSLKFEEFYKKFYSFNSCDTGNSLNFSKTEECDINSANGESVSRAQMVADMLDWASRILNSQPYLTAMTLERQHETRQYLERLVMSQLHRSSIILNDDVAEIERDNIFNRELDLLQKVITPGQLSISKKFHSLLPFEGAQKELLRINCYKTPLDKVSCIQKTTHKIAILLKMINSDFIPGADDILPVLIYVIIMANPPRLLSNMSFIEVLCGSQLEGQSQYMWCQFSAAVNEVRRLLTVLPRFKK